MPNNTPTMTEHMTAIGMAAQYERLGSAV
jgi:hypothetical protein